MELPANPTSPLFSLLTLALPGIWLLARVLVSRITDDPPTRGVLIPGITFSIWMISVHAAGLITGSFLMGLTLGTVAPAVLGVALHRKLGGGRVGWPNVFLIILAIVGASYLLPTMINTDFHDKQGSRVTHFSIFSNIINGFYPPRDLVFPDHALHYHYGIDMFAAVVSVLCRARIDVAFDVVTFLGFGYAILVFGGVGAALFGKKGQLPTAFLCGFHGGFPWIYGAAGESREIWLMSILHGVKGQWIAPPSTCNLFQMPFSAGYPLFGLVVLIATTVSPGRNNRASAIALALALSVTSFLNITVFLTVTGALLAYFSLLWIKQLIRPTSDGGRWSLLPPLLGILCAVGVSCIISGFADIILKTGSQVILKTPKGMTGELYSNLQWNWGSFGFLIPASILGVFFISRFRTFLVLHAVVCLYIINFYKYAHTWDIIKFGFVAELSLAILSASLVSRLLRGGYVLKVVALLVIAGISAPAISYHLPFWEGKPHPFVGGLSLVRGAWLSQQGIVVTPDELQAITWLRGRVGKEDVVLRKLPTADLYASLGGLPVFQPDNHTIAFNNSEARIRERYFIIQTLPKDIQVYRKEGAKWAVVDVTPGAVDPFSPLVAQWEAQGMAVKQVSFNNLAVFELMN